MARPRKQNGNVPDGFEWSEPPPVTRNTRTAQEWMQRLAPLVDSPNTWARVKVFKSQGAATSAASRLRTGRMRLPEAEGEWEFASRAIDENSNGLWARFTPAKGRRR